MGSMSRGWSYLVWFILGAGAGQLLVHPYAMVSYSLMDMYREGSDGEIFHVITDGVKGTAMQSFKKGLSKEMRWNLVNYIKSLKGQKKD